MGGHFIHDPIQYDTDPRYDTGVVVMDTEFIIYIHLDHFSLLSQSPTMTCRYVH